MSVNDQLGKRIKNNYEKPYRHYLTRRMPIAIRLDGKAFHTFTKGFERPFDRVLGNAMVTTMQYLCENIQGCVFGYTQSDEITLILIDYQTFDTQPWFDYRADKLISISASMATLAFNRAFEEEVKDFFAREAYTNKKYDFKEERFFDEKMENLYVSYLKSASKGGCFDARVFNIPKEEVCNLIFWRQLDATRNSIQMVGQAHFSHDELNEKTCSDIQDMLMDKYNINWNNYPVRWKRGVAWRPDCKVDYNMPILRGDDRSYVDSQIYVGEK